MEIIENLLRIAEGELEIATTCRNITLAGKEKRIVKRRYHESLKKTLKTLKKSIMNFLLMGDEN